MSPTWGFKTRSSTSFIIVAVCIGLFTDSITICSIIPILPSALVTRVGVPEEQAQFYISVFMASCNVAFFIAAPIFGYLSDRLATKRLPFLCGMVANIVSLVLFMRATSVVSMVMARTLQGVSSSAILVVGTALVKDTVSAEKSGQGMAFTTIAVQLGLILGPAFGGLVYDNIGYEAVFIAPAMLLAMDIVLRLLVIEKPVRPKRKQADQESSSEGIQNHRETDPLLKSSETTPGDPSSTSQPGKKPLNNKTIMDTFPTLRLLTDGRVATALFVTLTDCIQWGSMESTIPLYVMRTFHWTPSNAGALLLISCTPGILLSYVMGNLIDQSGSLYPAAFGVSIAGACQLAQRLVHSNVMRDKVLLTAFFTTGNVAMLFVQITMSVEIGLAAQQVADSFEGQNGKMVGQAYALYMMVQSCGSLLGPVVGGATIEVLGWAGMTTLLGALCLLGLPCILLCTKGGVATRRST